MSEWIEWKGGSCPLQPNQKFDARFGDESVYEGASGWEWEYFFDEAGERFTAGGDPLATAYRVAST